MSGSPEVGPRGRFGRGPSTAERTSRSWERSSVAISPLSATWGSRSHVWGKPGVSPTCHKQLWDPLADRHRLGTLSASLERKLQRFSPYETEPLTEQVHAILSNEAFRD